jgi:hypothetical protein
MRALLPIGIVIFAFIIQQGLQLSSARYLSILALVYYLIILLVFRINRTVSLPEEDTLISPINGKVTDIRTEKNEHIVEIKKLFYQPADVRLSDSADVSSEVVTSYNKQWIKKSELIFTNAERKTSWSLSGRNIYYFFETMRKKGGLTAIIPGNGSCTLRLSDQYHLNIQQGDKLEAGSSIIGTSL